MIKNFFRKKRTYKYYKKEKCISFFIGILVFFVFGIILYYVVYLSAYNTYIKQVESVNGKITLNNQIGSIIFSTAAAIYSASEEVTEKEFIDYFSKMTYKVRDVKEVRYFEKRKVSGKNAKKIYSIDANGLEYFPENKDYYLILQNEYPESSVNKVNVYDISSDLRFSGLTSQIEKNNSFSMFFIKDIIVFILPIYNKSSASDSDHYNNLKGVLAFYTDNKMWTFMNSFYDQLRIDFYYKYSFETDDKYKSLHVNEDEKNLQFQKEYALNLANIVLKVKYSKRILIDKKEGLLIVSVFALSFFISILMYLILKERKLLKNNRRYIERKNKDILARSDELEQMVKVRTSELAEANELLNLKNTELQNTIDALHETRDLLLVAERYSTAGSMIAGISHEINTPLGNARTASSFLISKVNKFMDSYKNNTVTKQDFEKIISVIMESAKMIDINMIKASELISSFKNVTADQTHEHCRNFNVKQYIDEIFLSIKPRLRRTNHSILVECSENLYINSYPGMLSQIITNLAINSIIHGFENIERGVISISCFKKNSMFTLIYADNGCGMTPEVKEHVFDSFFTTKRGKGGTGLGMNIVYNIVVEELKGSIECESSPGNGVKFTISFLESVNE